MSITSAPSSFCSGVSSASARAQAVEDDRFDLKLQSLHRANRILQAIEIPVDDVHVHFDSRAEHCRRDQQCLLAIDEEVLADRVQDVVLRRQIDRLRVLDHVLDILLRDLAVLPKRLDALRDC
jgi:hypothetical protein